MSYWNDVAEAKATVNSTYIRPGHYVVRIDDWKQGQNRNNRPFLALETTIVESDNHDDHPPGSSATWMGMLDQDATKGNIKVAVMEFLNIPEDEVTGDIIERCVTPDGESGVSPLAGVLAEVTAVNIKTREGNDFTRVMFKHWDPEKPLLGLEHRVRQEPAPASAPAPA